MPPTTAKKTALHTFRNYREQVREVADEAEMQLRQRGADQQHRCGSATCAGPLCSLVQQLKDKVYS